MTTAARTLVNQVSDLLGNNGDGFTTLAAAVSTTDGTTVSLTSVEDVTVGMYILIDDEVMLVTALFDTNPATATVVRGDRGTTGATHSSGALVILNPIWSTVDIVRALNQAQDAVFPSLYVAVQDTDDVMDDEQEEYPIPSTINHLTEVAIETSVDGIYDTSRDWEYVTDSIIRIGKYVRYDGRTIRFTGYGKFDAMTLSGNLDSDFPDTNANAIEYLVIKATSNMLKERQALIGRRDAFVGITDAFQEGQPFMSALTARELDKHASELKKQIRMPRLPEYLPDPGRIYGGRY